ncbi:hypothetical protein Hanom_Chr01g00004291 [Helianthus anomalus]
MVKPDLDIWTLTDRVVNRFCILCLIGSHVGSGRVFLFAHPRRTWDLQRSISLAFSSFWATSCLFLLSVCIGNNGGVIFIYEVFNTSSLT